MLYIDGKPFEMSASEIRQYKMPHTWTLNAGRIKWNHAMKRIETIQAMYIPTIFRAQFHLTPSSPKVFHQVIYSTGQQPNPADPNHPHNLPQSIIIEKGVREGEKDQEINWFLDHCPHIEGSLTWDSKGTIRALGYKYKAEKAAVKAENNAEKMVRMIEKISQMSEEELIGAGRGVMSKVSGKVYLKVNDELLADEDTRREALLGIKAGLLTFAQEQPTGCEMIIIQKETQIFTLVEQARAEEILWFDTKDQQIGNQGTWKITANDGIKQICMVDDKTRPLDVLVTFLQGVKNEKYEHYIKNAIADKKGEQVTQRVEIPDAPKITKSTAKVVEEEPKVEFYPTAEESLKELQTRASKLGIKEAYVTKDREKLLAKIAAKEQVPA